MVVLLSLYSYCVVGPGAFSKIILLQAVDAWIDKHTKATAKVGPNQMVTFEGDLIALDIAEDGDALENGWEITPYTFPGVSVYSLLI